MNDLSYNRMKKMEQKKMSAQNHSKGYCTEQKTKEWLKNHPNFKSFTNIYQPENDKGIDFVADSFDKKVAVQV